MQRVFTTVGCHLHDALDGRGEEGTSTKTPCIRHTHLEPTRRSRGMVRPTHVKTIRHLKRKRNVQSTNQQLLPVHEQNLLKMIQFQDPNLLIHTHANMHAQKGPLGQDAVACTTSCARHQVQLAGRPTCEHAHPRKCKAC